MTDFAAIDFETANYDRSSVCSVGVVIVRDGAIVESSTRSSNPSPTIITIGARKFTDFAALTLTTHPSSPMYGSKLNRSLMVFPEKRELVSYSRGSHQISYRVPIEVIEDITAYCDSERLETKENSRVGFC